VHFTHAHTRPELSTLTSTSKGGSKDSYNNRKGNPGSSVNTQVCLNFNRQSGCRFEKYGRGLRPPAFLSLLRQKWPPILQLPHQPTHSTRCNRRHRITTLGSRLSETAQETPQPQEHFTCQLVRRLSYPPGRHPTFSYLNLSRGKRPYITYSTYRNHFH